MNLFHDLLFDYTLRTVALGSAVLGVVSGMLGCFAVLRRQSLLGDVVSHAALPGIALAFLLTGSKSPLILILGALAAGWLGTLVVLGIVNTTRLKDDTALGLILSVFFGIGLMLLTFIQKTPTAAQAGLEKFLFGQAAALLASDVITMSVLGLFSVIVLLLFWKEFKLVTFDREYALSLGLPVRGLEIGLTTLIVLAIVLGLQTVGVVLMSAMVVAPAAAARQWTDRLGGMVGLSALFGALSGVSGAVISSSMARLPTGPTIVLCMSAIVAVSMFFAPNRGLAWRWTRNVRNRRRLVQEAVLCDLYELELQHDESARAHAPQVLKTMNRMRADARGVLKELEAKGWAESDDAGAWMLTEAGQTHARELARSGGDA
jgi:manganese/zinc/iron transport system permease protein